MALDNFRAEQLRAANTLYAHSAYQAQQQQNQQNALLLQQQHSAGGNLWFHPSRQPNPSNSSNLHHRSPLSPPSTVASTSNISTSQQYSRENSQTPSNFSDIPIRSSKSINSASKRKATRESEGTTASSSESSSAGIEREIELSGNRKRNKSNEKPSHEEAMNALRARCERNNRDRQQSGSSSTSATTADEGGALLHKKVSLPVSITSSDNPSSFSPQVSPSLSISTTASSVFFSPSLTSPSTTSFIPNTNSTLSHSSTKSHLSREEARFLAMSTLRPIVDIAMPTSTITALPMVGSPEPMEVEPVDMNEPSSVMVISKSMEGTSVSLRRLLNSGSERRTVTRVSDVRGE